MRKNESGDTVAFKTLGQEIFKQVELAEGSAHPAFMRTDSPANAYSMRTPTRPTAKTIDNKFK